MMVSRQVEHRLQTVDPLSIEPRLVDTLTPVEHVGDPGSDLLGAGTRNQEHLERRR